MNVDTDDVNLVKDINLLFNGSNMSYAQDCLVIAPEFLVEVAKHRQTFVRSVAADHPNTPAAVLAELVEDESPIVYYAAMGNRHTPFYAVFMKWYELMPDHDVNEFPVVLGRKEDYLSMIAQLGLTEDDVATLPKDWIVKGIIQNIKKVAV